MCWGVQGSESPLPFRKQALQPGSLPHPLSPHPGVGTQHGRRAQLVARWAPSINSLSCVNCVALQCVSDDASLANEVRTLVAQRVPQQASAPAPMDDPLLEELLDLNDDIPVRLPVFWSFDQCD